MKRVRVLHSGVVSQQIEGKTYARKKGDVIEVSDEAFAHLVSIGEGEPVVDEPASKRADR